ncbi:MAG: hypothetical protein ACK52I_08735 [Pseudomonadota bacterium]
MTGVAAHAMVAEAHSLHVPEPADRYGASERMRVATAAQPPEPPGNADECAVSRTALAADVREAPSVVRRCCRGPSPESRDRVCGWHTGRRDRVFGGDFDLRARPAGRTLRVQRTGQGGRS